MTAPAGHEWIITRPLEAGMELVRALAGHGVKARAVPCLERTPMPWPQWQPREGETVVVLATSAEVADGVAALFRQFGPSLVVAAVAPATRDALVARGVAVALEGDGGVEALASTVLRWLSARTGPARVLYPTSDAAVARRDASAGLSALAAVATVEQHAVYTLSVPSELPQRLQALTDAPRRVLFASPSTVDAFLAAGGAQLPPADLVAVWGDSTRERWQNTRPTGWPDATPLPREGGVVDGILRLEEGATR